MRNASIFDNSQLMNKEIVKSALFQHYGYENKNGVWVAGSKAREIPGDLEALSIRQIFLYDRQSTGLTAVVKTIDLFNKEKGSAGKHNTNQDKSVLQDNTFRVFAGLKLRNEIAGAGLPAAGDLKFTAAEIATLDFDPIADPNILNGNIALKVSQRKVYDNEPIGPLLDNIDGVNNYIRFERLLIQEPGEKIELTLDAPANYAALNVFEAVLCGWELFVSKS